MCPRLLSWTKGLWPFCYSSSTHTCSPLSWFWGAFVPSPHPPPNTHCLRAGAPALPETGSRGGSALPLLIFDSSIHTEKHRVCWVQAGGLQGPLWEVLLLC